MNDSISFSQAIACIHQGEDLSSEQTGHLLDAMLRGQAAEPEIAEFLLALRAKGEAVSELVGAARALRQHMTPVPHHYPTLLDTCGTGGSGSGTFNISTCVAILTAACGVPVAKHGNRKATSRSGSADVLECLGVKIESDAREVSTSLNEIGICFCFAAKLHPAMRHVVAIRRRLGVPTLFNLLGPLCNPAGATHQLLGTASPLTQVKVAEALAQLETRRSFVLHAEDGQDEVSLSGVTSCIEVTPSGRQNHRWMPSDFELSLVHQDAIQANDPAESARIIQAVLDGAQGPHRDTVLAGTAAALMLVQRVSDLVQGVAVAAQAIQSGAAKEKLIQLQSR